jgi:hypothetical protein
MISCSSPWGLHFSLVVACLSVAARLQSGEPGPTAPAGKAVAQPDAQPITTAQGPLADLLKKWHAQGTAAGNTGDYYDNRDRGHSDLNLSLYPQLQRLAYPEQARKMNLDWAAQRAVLPITVFGNSSTSSGVHQGGSNPRMLYTHPMGLKLLYLQYTGNNLYIYPEHCDYDPGHNGTPGFGDLYPTNTPYVMISQGSSGSDQPFMQAAASTLAAFRPEVKKKLIQSGLLMPTVQMIFRMTNKQVADPKDYLTGKAHPTVFQGAEVDALKMAQMAHQIKPDELPPMIQLKVIEEDVAAPGRDYFEAAGDEVLAETSAVIARICRSRSYTRRIVVSAEDSYDRNNRPLRWHWVVLRGDAPRIRIKPLGAHASRAEIVVPWHDRRPIAEGSSMESNRVDIGVFVHNGAYYSAPGFVTFLFLDSEARTYDDRGRLLEIGYGMGESDVQVTNWPGLMELLQPGAGAPGARVLKQAFSETEQTAVVAAIGEYRSRHAELESAREKRKQAEAQKKPEAELKAVRQAEDAAAKAEDEALSKRRDALQGPLKEVVVGRLRKVIGSPLLHNEAGVLAALPAEQQRREAADRVITRLAGWGLYEKGQLSSVYGTAAFDRARTTRFERAVLEQVHGDLLCRVALPGVVQYNWKVNYVDPSLSAPKSWRDVYHYDGQGNCTGWTRYDGRQTSEFRADGWLVAERDAQGRCLKARPVRYLQEKPKPDGQPHFGPNWNPLRCVPEGAVEGNKKEEGRGTKKE